MYDSQNLKLDDFLHLLHSNINQLTPNRDVLFYSNLRCEGAVSYKVYMVYKNNRTLGCTASAKITPTGEFAVMNAHHNHPREEGNIRAAEFFIRQLREACVREGGILKNIYEHAAIRNPDGAVTVSFNSIRSSMLRWRQATTPNVPANLEEFE